MQRALRVAKKLYAEAQNIYPLDEYTQGHTLECLNFAHIYMVIIPTWNVLTIDLHMTKKSYNPGTWADLTQ